MARFGESGSVVGAVYDRTYFVDFRKKRAVIDRAYRFSSSAGICEKSALDHRRGKSRLLT
jgi:hypothetical protein